MDKITVFANFFINTEERFMRMKDSFKSMSEITVDRWVINIRGLYSDEAILFFNSNLDNAVLFSLDSGNWFYDSLQMSTYIRTNYILTWLEDTICLKPLVVNHIVSEMSANAVDILCPTYWCDGYSKRRYEGVTELYNGTNIDFFNHTIKNNFEVQNNKYNIQSYIIGYMAIINIDLFERVLLDNGGKSRWSKSTPFAFEKAPYDVDWLPLKRGVPHIEIFASIDDNLCVPGSCLQDRGLYPIREVRDSYAFDRRTFFKKVYDKLNIKIIFKLYRILVNVFSVPIPNKIDYLSSFSLFSKNKKGQSSDMSYDYIDYILSLNLNVDKVFEYGSGESQEFFANMCSELFSVDHDKSIYLKRINDGVLDKNIVYNIVEPEAIDRSKSDATCEFESDIFKGYSFDSYVNSIDKYPDDYFDIIIINGVSRIGCLSKCIHKVRRNGLIIINNTNKETVKFCRDYSEFFESTAFVSGVVKGSIVKQDSSISVRK